MAKAKHIKPDEKESRIAIICDALAEGKSLRQIARDMGMGESRLRYWLMSDAEAFAQFTRAKELGCDALSDECIDIADEVGVDPQEKRIRIDTRIRLIGKWSQRYGDKVKHEGSGPNGEIVQIVKREIVDPNAS